MKKKPTSRRTTKPTYPIKTEDRSWHNGGDIEIHMYARSLQRAARALVEKLPLEQNPKTAYDACPVVLLYRQALELHLKALVGEGCNFLPLPTDPITLFTTHSLRWLAQIVGQIIRAVKWESEFKCEGIASLADFSALVNEIESFEPVTKVIQSIKTAGPDSITNFYRTFDMVQFAKKLDGLLDLLAATADGLAATSDLMDQGPANSGSKPTIH